jgi:hypothetical protein
MLLDERMARTTVTHITDDLDGSANAEEVSFGFNGVEYTIDLGKKNRGALEKALKPYLEAARKVPKSGRSSRRGSAAGPSRDLNAIRSWAREQGITVSERGRIAQDVIAQYEAAH